MQLRPNINLKNVYFSKVGSAYQIKDQGGTYYLTLQVVGWVDVFTRKENKDVIINNLKYCQVHKGLKIYAFVIMSNHIHLIVRSETESLSDTIGDFKKYVSKVLKKQLLENNKESRRDWMKVVFEYHAKFNKRVGEFQLWTHHNHAILLDSNEKFESRENYIHLNPVRAGIVRNPEDYLYSSAGFYYDKEILLDIEEK